MSKKFVRKYIAALVVMAAGLVVCGGVVAGTDVLRSENPSVEMEYSTKELTKEDVTVRMKGLPEGTVIKNNDGSDTYVFTDNGEFTFEFTADGRDWKATAAVDWIDKRAPSGFVVFLCTTSEGVEVACDSETGKTNRPVVAKLVIEDEPQGYKVLNNLVPKEEVEEGDATAGDSSAEGGKEEGGNSEPEMVGSDRFVFERNGIFTFEVQDKAGNVGKIAARVDWIDTAAPKVEVKYDPERTEEGCGQVTARLEKVTEGEAVEPVAGPEIADFVPIVDENVKYDAEGLQYGEDYILTDENGVQWMDDVATHVFTEDGSFEFKYRDEAGNEGTATATVDWIKPPVVPENPDDPEDGGDDNSGGERPGEEPGDGGDEPGDGGNSGDGNDSGNQGQMGDFQDQDPGGAVGAGLLGGEGGLGEMSTAPGMLDYVAPTNSGQQTIGQVNPGQQNPGQQNPGQTVGQVNPGQSGADQGDAGATANLGQQSPSQGDASSSQGNAGSSQGDAGQASGGASASSNNAGQPGATVAVVDDTTGNEGDGGEIDGGTAGSSSVTEVIGLPAGVKPQSTPLVLDNGLRGQFGSNSEYFQLSFVDGDGKTVAGRPEEVTFELPTGKTLAGVYSVKDDGTTEPVAYEYSAEGGKIVIKDLESGKYLFDYEDKKVETTPAKEESAQENTVKKEWYDNPVLLWGLGGAAVILVIGIGAAIIKRHEYDE